MRLRSTLLAAVTVATACLPALAPNLRSRGVHGGLGEASSAGDCLACHPSQREIQPGERASAPIVAAWMIDESRACVDCHRVRGRARAARDQLPALTEVVDAER